MPKRIPLRPRSLSCRCCLPGGEACINFEGTIGCVPDASSWCAINPITYEGVGCWNGTCWYGQEILPFIRVKAY